MKSKLILFCLIWFVGIIVISIMVKQTMPIPAYIYWIILGLFIFSVWLFKLRNRFILSSSFGLFILSGLLTVFNLVVIAELIARISLLGFLIGFIQSLISHKGEVSS